MVERFMPGDFICGRVYQITVIALSEEDSDDITDVYDVVMCIANNRCCIVTQVFGNFLHEYKEKENQQLKNKQRAICHD